MPHQSAKSNAINPSRCRHSTVDGRRCRLAALADNSGLCFRHRALSESHDATSNTAPDPEALAAELLGDIQDFSTADSVNLFLGNLVKQLARKRIARRDAIALAYLSQLLLNSLPALRKEFEEERDAAAGEELINSLLQSRSTSAAQEQFAETPEAGHATSPHH